MVMIVFDGAGGGVRMYSGWSDERSFMRHVHICSR